MKFDEVAIFNTALIDDELKTIMTKGLKIVADVEPPDKLTTTWAAIKAH